MTTTRVTGRPGLGPAASLRAVAAVAVAALLLSACGSGRQLETTFESPTALAQAVVDGLNRKDPAMLERLALTEDEFRELVWPRQPAARPGRNIPWDYVWKDLSVKSRWQLRGRLAAWPAAPVAVEAVTFDGDTTDYDSYRVMRKSKVTLRDASGQRTTVRLFGSIIEQGGRYKVFSFVAE
jgi:hypothetical protein